MKTEYLLIRKRLLKKDEKEKDNSFHYHPAKVKNFLTLIAERYLVKIIS